MAKNSTVHELGLGFLRAPSRGPGLALYEQPVRDHPVGARSLVLTLSIAPCEKSRNLFSRKGWARQRVGSLWAFQRRGRQPRGKKPPARRRSWWFGRQTGWFGVLCIWPCYWSQLQPIAAVGFAVRHVRVSGSFDGRFDSEMAGIELHTRGAVIWTMTSKVTN